MADTDAFGRDRDDDPLAAMGWSGATAAPPETGAAPERAEAAPQAPPPRQPYRIPSYEPPPPSRSAGRWVRRVFVLALLGGIGALIYAVAVPGVSDIVDEVEQALDEAEVTAPPRPGGASDTADTPPPVGFQRRSLILRGNLSPALRELRSRAGGEIRSLRIAPDRIDVQVYTNSGRLRNFQRRWDGRATMLSDTSAPGLGAAPSVSWAQVNASAPRRIARRMLAGGRPSRELDYLVLLNAAGIRWSAFRTDGTGFTATADGRNVRRIGG